MPTSPPSSIDPMESRRPREDVTIGILAALPVEGAAMLSLSDDLRDFRVPDDLNLYRLGSLPSKLPDRPHGVALLMLPRDGAPRRRAPDLTRPQHAQTYSLSSSHPHRRSHTPPDVKKTRSLSPTGRAGLRRNPPRREDRHRLSVGVGAASRRPGAFSASRAVAQ
jgi:hypothetical protein